MKLAKVLAVAGALGAVACTGSNTTCSVGDANESSGLGFGALLPDGGLPAQWSGAPDSVAGVLGVVLPSPDSKPGAFYLAADGGQVWTLTYSAPWAGPQPGETVLVEHHTWGHRVIDATGHTSFFSAVSFNPQEVSFPSEFSAKKGAEECSQSSQCGTSTFFKTDVTVGSTTQSVGFGQETKVGTFSVKGDMQSFAGGPAACPVANLPGFRFHAFRP